MIPAKDISKYQGNWRDTGEPIVMVKMSGGDNGLYMDSMAGQNYDGAVKAGRAVGGYHFGGGELSAEAEAAYFLKAMSPLAENDVYALDVEAALAARSDVVQWVRDFAMYIHGKINVWPLIYMNLSTLKAHDWFPVLKDCGLWLADWDNNPEATIPTHYTYVMQQYNDGPNYDHDEWFGTVEEFKAYGYHKQPVAQEPVPTPVSAPSPTPSVPSQPAEVPVQEPASAPVPVSTPVPAPVTTQPTPPKAIDIVVPKGTQTITLPTQVTPKLNLWQRMPTELRLVLHTFWQAAGGVLVAGLLAAHSSADVRLTLAGAVTIGLSAVKNLFIARRGN